MTCASETGMTGETSAMDGPDLSMGLATISAPADGQRGFDCGCAQSCQATSLASQTVAPVPDPTPHVAATDMTQPPSVVRAPLLPPPEPTTA
jgi:hypothetical protein